MSKEWFVPVKVLMNKYKHYVCVHVYAFMHGCVFVCACLFFCDLGIELDFSKAQYAIQSAHAVSRFHGN